MKNIFVLSIALLIATPSFANDYLKKGRKTISLGGSLSKSRFSDAQYSLRYGQGKFLTDKTVLLLSGGISGTTGAVLNSISFGLGADHYIKKKKDSGVFVGGNFSHFRTVGEMNNFWSYTLSARIGYDYFINPNTAISTTYSYTKAIFDSNSSSRFLSEDSGIFLSLKIFK